MEWLTRKRLLKHYSIAKTINMSSIVMNVIMVGKLERSALG